MRKSIRVKLTLILTSLMAVTIFLTWLINSAFLDDFYLNSKKTMLGEIYDEVQDIYGNNEEYIYLTEENTEEMERLVSNYDVSVSIYLQFADIFYNLIYPAPNDIGLREALKNDSLLKEYLQPGSNPDIHDMELIYDTEEYGIFTLYDDQLETRYIDLLGNLGNGKLMIVRSNFESIEESTKIANKFLSYIGLLTTIIGVIVMMIISKKFTQPILELADITKKMTNLDFNVKYKVTSNDEIGELGNSVNTLSDQLESTISELKQANNELLLDIQKKTEIDDMRKEFLANVSHELKTPLSLIQGYAEGLKEGVFDDDESRDYYLEVIMDEADKMNKMVKKLLILNEIEFGKNPVEFQRFNIVELINSVLSMTEILFKQKNVTLHFEEKEPIYVWADELMVEQVVTNYISNALNHVSGDNIIEIKLIPRGDVVRIAVFNTGESIPEEELEKIWIKFYKVDKARTREYGGSGIGLSIVKAIMNSHNKECGAINRPTGVEFWFELDIK